MAYLHHYKVVYYCTSFIIPGLAFFFFPILAILFHFYVCPKINKKPTDSKRENNLIGAEFEFQESIEYKEIEVSEGCCRSCADILLHLTIGTSQFFFGSTTIQLKDKIFYKERCIKIGRRYYELSFGTLLPLVWSNACVLASLTAVFFAYFIVKETSTCDESIDCFLADESNTTRITDCSMFNKQRIQVKCYEITFQFLYAFSFIGGLLKFVPILFKAVIVLFLTRLSEQTKCIKCLRCLNVGVVLFFIGGFIIFSILLFMHPTHWFILDTIQMHLTMKRIGLGMATLAQIGAIFIYPWHKLNKNIIEQIDLKISREKQEEQIRNRRSHDQDQLKFKPNYESTTQFEK